MKYELGPLEAELIFTLERKGVTVFTVDDARDLLKASDETLWRVLHKLTRKGRIQRIKRGYYVLVPARAGYQPRWREQAYTFLEEMLEEYYVGYWTAMSHWNMTEQTPRTVFVATTNRKRGFVYDDAVPIHFVTLNPRKLYGWVYAAAGGHRFRVSDPEKTVVDSMDLPQHSGGIPEAAKSLHFNLDWDKVIEYTDRLGNRTVHKRLGYLIQLLDIDAPSHILRHLKAGISSGYGWLDPTAPKEEHERDATWKMKINVPKKALRS
ncbi:type IV toxin-antitoxin system AbiEi family antitoxin domain-containing protein [Candidatus Bathyarchaeota archaeon]|nr:type IV toxin-antitoxin system AbiEi family antitoxin domain-containing protein [Candidatus Bathyarchaeota archaeon]